MNPSMSENPGDLRAAARRKRLVAAAAVTLAATAWAALQPDEPRPSPARRQADTSSGSVGASSGRKPAAPVASAPAAWPGPPGTRLAWQAAPAQAVAAWGAPPAPPAPSTASRPQAAPVPTAATPAEAPAFPYTLIGRLDDGEARALLSGPTRSFGVKAADVIDGQWRVDAVAPRGLMLTWLPGGVKKTLALAPS